jgi:hypothetical protein
MTEKAMTCADVFEIVSDVRRGSVLEKTTLDAHRSAWDLSVQIPVFRDGMLNSVIDRPHGLLSPELPSLARHSGLSGDTRIERRLSAALRQEPRVCADLAGVMVERGVVRFWGEVDSVHAVIALRSMAAGIPEVIAIIDDLWVTSE